MNSNDIRNGRELLAALEENRSRNEFVPEYEYAADLRRRHWKKKQRRATMHNVISVVGALIFAIVIGLVIVFWR